MLYALDQIRPETQGDDFWVADNATVVGRVRLGRWASVWFNAVVRGDTDWIEIGDGSNVQDGAILHTDPGITLSIGPNVTIGHKVMLHGCTIGEDSLVGINSVVLNRARIGRNCLVGAGSLITEGKEFPDGSMIMGAPAKVVRPLREQEIAMLKLSAQGYVANAKRFKTGLQPVG
ncbi:gamma carbonic anhydrase family protein [Zavarzinia sp. CC-PAN008]|uniref:gamma carbonic anhydrase family protein n=1 Tax=Zavarzinia sp. CC-PAN008 TaxID=3243332 RepID=UPI003F746FD3